MVREALFSILGDAVPGRAFFDLFAGTGAIGLEALSRGAAAVVLVERDFRVAAEIERHVHQFQVADRATVVRADVYRWAERWPGSTEPANVFLGPPYADFERRLDMLLTVIERLQAKTAPGSVVVVQAEDAPWLNQVARGPGWENRRYGRNHLLIWLKETVEHAPGTAVEQP
jgi:16S rRNA (guanine(966)-N(2))-methyltransferase RsmD